MRELCRICDGTGKVEDENGVDDFVRSMACCGCCHGTGVEPLPDEAKTRPDGPETKDPEEPDD